jgi:hypothetical protein
LKSFLGYALTETTPDHSTISRPPRLIDLETHSRVFTWMLEVLADTDWLTAKRRHRRDDIGGECGEQMEKLADNDETAGQIAENWLAELVKDKGYHSNETMVEIKKSKIRCYISEPKRGRRNWTG